jgi:hypothetical protein
VCGCCQKVILQRLRAVLPNCTSLIPLTSAALLSVAPLFLGTSRDRRRFVLSPLDSGVASYRAYRNPRAPTVTITHTACASSRR